MVDVKRFNADYARSAAPRQAGLRQARGESPRSSGPSLFLGIDGGGSGCRARIADAQGRTLGAGTAAPAAVRLGVDRALAAMQSAARAATADAGFPTQVLARLHAVAGLAGIGRKAVLEALNARPHPFASIAYTNDATIACLGAHGGDDGGVVIVGTGSVALGFVNGREIRAGGYGFPISDEGSGADLGLRAVRLALRAHDGRWPTSDFTAAVMTRFRGDPFEAVAWADSANATDYAQFAPLVMDHAENGDAIAREIVVNAATEIDELARRLVARGAQRIALLGGLAPRMTAWLADDVRARLVAPQGDAIDGALCLARRIAETRSPQTREAETELMRERR